MCLEGCSLPGNGFLVQQDSFLILNLRLFKKKITPSIDRVILVL